MSTLEWFAEFEREEAERLDRVETAKTAAAEEHRKLRADELSGVIEDIARAWAEAIKRAIEGKR